MNLSRPDKPPIRVALIGCGAVAEIYHAPALEQLCRAGTVVVAGIFDPSDQAIARLQTRFPLARRLQEVDEVASADLAIVASPPKFHASQTIAALNAGVSVLCEKPMACSVLDARAMASAADRSGSTLAVGFVRRFLPAAEVIGSILRHRALGDIRSVTCFEGSAFRWPARTDLFFDTAGGGGVLADIGVHMFDLLAWWLGTADDVFYEDDAAGGVEANCRFVLSFREGFQVEGRLTRDWELPNRYFFDCANGWIGWNLVEPDEVQIGLKGTNYVLAARLHDGQVIFQQPAAGGKSRNFEQGFIAQVLNVIDAGRKVAALRCSAADGIESLRMVERCYENRRPMTMAWMSEPEQHALASFGLRRT